MTTILLKPYGCFEHPITRFFITWGALKYYGKILKKETLGGVNPCTPPMHIYFQTWEMNEISFSSSKLQRNSASCIIIEFVCFINRQWHGVQFRTHAWRTHFNGSLHIIKEWGAPEAWFTYLEILRNITWLFKAQFLIYQDIIHHFQHHVLPPIFLNTAKFPYNKVSLCPPSHSASNLSLSLLINNAHSITSCCFLRMRCFSTRL